LTGTVTFTPVAQLQQFEPSGSKQTIVDQTNLSSPGYFTESAAVQISERSFACNGCFESTSAYGDVLKSLALSMAGFVVPPGDCWRIYAGAYVPPTVTLTDPDCRGAIKADLRLSARDTCNGVKGQYIPGFLPINPLGPLAASPASPAWKKTDFPPVQRANYIEEDGGIILWKDIQLDFTISLWMAQRIARIVLERLRRAGDSLAAREADRDRSAGCRCDAVRSSALGRGLAADARNISGIAHGAAHGGARGWHSRIRYGPGDATNRSRCV
jgi:hypothetical protein